MRQFITNNGLTATINDFRNEYILCYSHIEVLFLRGFSHFDFHREILHTSFSLKLDHIFFSEHFLQEILNKGSELSA